MAGGGGEKRRGGERGENRERGGRREGESDCVKG